MSEKAWQRQVPRLFAQGDSSRACFIECSEHTVWSGAMHSALVPFTRGKGAWAFFSCCSLSISFQWFTKASEYTRIWHCKFFCAVNTNFLNDMHKPFFFANRSLSALVALRPYIIALAAKGSCRIKVLLAIFLCSLVELKPSNTRDVEPFSK